MVAAFSWGFDKWYGQNWQGNEEIRESLIDAGRTAIQSAHRVLSGEFIEFVRGKNLTDLPGWAMHDLRLLVMALLANPNCATERQTCMIG